MRLKVTILGSGTSTGVPVIGCACEVCRSRDPKDQRWRASIAIENVATGQRLVIDTGPEFRLQMLRAKIDKVDAVLYTHTHADHCHGFDDLRAFSFKSKEALPCFVHRVHRQDFVARFSYAFEDTGYLGSKPTVDLRQYVDGAPFEAAGLTVEPALLPHGPFTSAALRFGKFLYCTDFKGIPAPLKAAWRGQIEVMVASGVHFGTHPAHNTVPETVALFQELEVKRGYVTHLGHEVSFGRDSPGLPSGVALAYDGLTIDSP